MADKTITVTEPTPLMDGMRYTFERVGTEWVVTVVYDPPGARVFSAVFMDSQISAQFKTDLQAVATRACNAAKAQWQF